MARQNFLAEKPTPGERIHNFVTSSTLAEHCEYGEEKDNMTRDQVLMYIRDKNLNAKLFRTDNLTLAKLLDVVSHYHDKEALILLPELQINRVDADEKQVNPPPKFNGKCYKCDKVGHMARDCRCSRNHVCETCGKVGHFAVCFRYFQDQPTTPRVTNKRPSYGLFHKGCKDSPGDRCITRWTWCDSRTTTARGLVQAIHTMIHTMICY